MPLKPGHSTAQEFTLPATTTAGAKRKAPTKQYIPKLRSGGWAILRALETFPANSSITKAEIVRVAHQYCDSSFDTPSENKFYTAWNSMKTLLEKGYVYKSGNPPKYCLTEEGAEVATTIANTVDPKGKGKDDGPSQKRQRSEEPQLSWIPPDSLGMIDRPVAHVPTLSRLAPQMSNASSNVSYVSHTSNRDVRVLPAGSYSIKLIMDNREIHSQVDKDRLEREIGLAGIDFSVRSLDIGDVLWVARSGSEEYVLDYIVERKRMDDLVSSITDGRFHEQKVASPSFSYLTV
jgi:crossover junction endonuclease MUS81